MGAEEEGGGGIKRIEIDEEGVVEGERLESDDYFFQRIGKPIPILKDHQHQQLFDLQSSPSPCCPIAVSEVHSLIFIANSTGFSVARTKDVIDGALDVNSSVQELSIVDVPIGKLHILSLSSDSSTLAVSVASHVHFFLVDSLLNKEVNPFLSRSLTQESPLDNTSSPSSPLFVKDFKWRRSKSQNCYLLLSNHGYLYHASALPSPLQRIMDNVDAVEWSLKGTYIAAAKANLLHIFSSKFEEKLRISLPLNSWTAESDNNSTVKVDSIRWVCPDCMVVGFVQQTADGMEENYLIQVIRTKDGKISDASSKPYVISYYDLFSGLIDDILPYGNGPYLLFSYLEQCGLAITANRKNTDQHILILSLLLKDNNETAIIDIDRDTWIPRIELQGNGDDNVIMGLCVDNVSVHAKIEVEVGLEQRELSPYCVLFCVTLEGKLVMFYVASATGATISPETDSAPNDEEEDSFLDLPAGGVQSNLPSGSEQVALGFQLKDVAKREPDIFKSNELPTKKDLMPSGKAQSSMTALVMEQKSHNDATTKVQHVESVVNFRPSGSDSQEKTSGMKMHQSIDGEKVQHFAQQSAKLGQSSVKDLSQEGPSYFVKHPSMTENNKFSELRSSPASFLEKAPAVPIQLNGEDFQRSVDLPKDSRFAGNSTGLQDVPSQPWSSEKVIFSGATGSRPSFVTSTSIQGHKSDSTASSVDPGNAPVGLAGKPFHLKDNVGASPLANFSVRPTQTVASVRTGTIDSLPSIRSSQLPSKESLASGRSPNHWPYSSKDAQKFPSSISEPYLSRQFGNIKEVAKELDSLLQCIEEPGGFRDACTVSQRGSVEALEEHMQTLSGRCRMWKSMMDERLVEIQHLLDKTVQVLARKIYMDGIVKQASDSHYWGLWNRQKLGSELELKRRHILKLNQVLTNQLIELERHFNAIEFHKFDENEGVHKDRRVFQSRYGPSRQIQSLHSLHNTTNSQLAAAEQLSECLSKQMALLSIESPVKQKNVKKELFETIGIPYDPAFSSPDSTKVSDASPLKKLLLSGSAANKSQSRRRQSSVIKSSDPEIARRRRDSLDRSWASFEPTKTTVKRILLQDTQNTSVKKSPLMDRQQLDPSVVDSSAVHLQKELISSSTHMYPSGNKGAQYTFPKQASEKKSTPSKWASDSLPLSQSTSQPTGLRSPMLQSDDAAPPSILPYQTLSAGRVLARESSNVTTSGRGSSTGKSDRLLIHENKSIQQSGTTLNRKSSVSMELPAQTPPSIKSNEVINYSAKGAMLTNPRIETANHGTTGVSPDPGNVPQFSVAASQTQPIEKASFSSSLAISSSSNIASSASILSSSAPSPTDTASFGMSLISSKPNTDVTQTVSLTPFSLVSSQGLPSGLSSLQALKSSFPLHTPPSISESSKTELQSANSTIPSMSEPVKTEDQLTTGNISFSVSPNPSPSTSVSPKAGLQPPAGNTLPSAEPTSLTSEPSKTQPQFLTDNFNLGTDVDNATIAPKAQPELPGFSLKHEPSVSSVPITVLSPGLGSGSQPSLNSTASPASGIQLNMQHKLTSDVHVPFGAPIVSDSAASVKSTNLDVTVTEEDEMEEEAPEASRVNEISLGSLGNFGLGSTPTSTAPITNPFGVSFGNIGTQASSSFTMTVPSGELFKPASFSFQSPQAAQPSPPTNMAAFPGGFGAKAVDQAPASSAFGQPAQIGAGQQALGSVLGSFGQSRQFGVGVTGGFASASSMGGFSSAATGGGFAAAASTGGGFASLASGGGGFGGFAGMASSAGGGFGGIGSGGGGYAAASPGSGGFAGAAGGGFSAAGGGFGAFNSQPGAGAFSAFGGNTGGTGKPPELFTQMRK